MTTETAKMRRNKEDVLRCVRQSSREGIGIFRPCWGFGRCFKLRVRGVYVQPR